MSSVDVLDRRVDTKTGNLITTRLVTGKSSLPEWVENVSIEVSDLHSVVDRTCASTNCYKSDWSIL